MVFSVGYFVCPVGTGRPVARGVWYLLVWSVGGLERDGVCGSTEQNRTIQRSTKAAIRTDPDL